MHEALRPLGEIRKLRDPVLLAAFVGFTDATGGVHKRRALPQVWGASSFSF